MSKINNDAVKGGTALVGGAAAGAGGAVTAVSTLGSVAGLGAAGITSGLATIGGVVGGGMAAGLLVVAAAPILAAGAGFGAFKLYTHLRDK